MSAKKPSLEVCVIVEDGDVIVQVDDVASGQRNIFDAPAHIAKCTLTVRNPHTETRATVTLNEWQAAALAELLQRVPGEEF